MFKGSATPLQAGYWSMDKGFNSKDVVTSSKDDGPTWADTQATVHNLIRTFIDNIRQGNFRVDSRDDDCTSTCDYHMTCRIAQVRSLKKTQWPDAKEL